MQRWVLHIDMDAFFASCEQLTRPTLMGRPVLVGGMSGRGVVAGASYEARKYGAHSAMPMYRAQQLVGPKAVVVRPRFEVYRLASQRVFHYIESHVELVEQLSIDEAYMEPAELVGASPEEVEAWAHELRAAIREDVGLPASIGAGSGKQFAKIGSGQAKPDGAFIIPADKQEEMLHPLDVDELWGVGPVTATKLHSIGVNTIGDLARLSQREVEIILGSTIGPSLWAMARGVDDRPVAPRAESKSVSAEHTYPEDLTSKDEVDRALERALTGAHRRLLKDGRGARTVTVKMRMADFHSETRSLTLAYATDDIATLRKAMHSLARYPAELGPIRLVGVGFSGLEAERQDVLFPELDQAMVSTETRFDEETTVADRTWHATQDVFHPEYGHGWIQGTGHGFVSVRFETRATGPGPFKSFAADDDKLQPADPIDSLAWDIDDLDMDF
ncbi:DNA polymerase IV [Corynebacterium ammoniagenes]|uniref:DNA polymerase IV n=2 Tax=Corynebacterium ammoniagenes TaxID=1697 RepID=A0AAV5G7R1_CORAM|nr:DNA polymerase IV [Corynebacterium ammoniagenes]APT82322.1 DNA polymerase IV [Corynebacterium ammoniagenes DSM 20306]AQS73411.1 DNA polymerase IV [Corynebacterium ammoniagenes]EFG82529.1 ImpB/MucB/SamB family protein [Corynebacterium ammoniagenes DSM 20306]NMF31072.1 DNA polymerase IV [Corynebacterium ammoniagenes]GJN42150.1 DNA polymerase IV [Corynebacterium ammoniagenes]